MNCKICGSKTNEIFKAQVIWKHDVTYYQCDKCKFIQTENPYWLDEAYKEAISSLDIGYITRNIMYSEITSSLIKHFYHRNNRFLDYGGGYGMFVRLMRDKGFDFYRQDMYCENLFSKYLDISDIEEGVNKKFKLLTAFEVFEHLENPISEIEKMLTYSNSILFSTEIIPKTQLNNSNDWWYFSPESGQHISFFSKESFDEIKRKFNCSIYSDGHSLHLITKKKFIINPIKAISYSHKIIDILLHRNFSNPKSLIGSDYKQAKKIIHQINSNEKSATF